jgi:predicted DNA binding CopG/RHH family protein
MSPREKEFTERINVFFTSEQMERIKAEAEKVGLTISAYVRMVVMKEVNRE